MQRGRNANRWRFDVRYGSLRPEEYELLKELVAEAGNHPGPIVEIGTLLGVTAQQMAIWAGPGKQVITVDNYSWSPWGMTPDSQWNLTALVLRPLVHSGQVQQVRANKNLWFERYQGPSPSLVFCDAIHTYEETKKDIEWALRVGAACVSGHDYCDQTPGVIQIVDELGGPEKLSGSVWKLKKTA